jgi:hypothetical protein
MTAPQSDRSGRSVERAGDREYDDPHYDAICEDVARRLTASCVHLEAASFEGLVRQICGRKFRWLQHHA